MSRIAKKPLEIPAGVTITLNNHAVTVKGKKGEFHYALNDAVDVKVEEKHLWVKPKKKSHPMVGTTFKLIGNMVQGVNDGFERKLQLVGVGYRAKAQGNQLELNLGFSHPVNFQIPKGITIETPSNTEIVITGADPQLVGQVAANIRAVRPPEPYKGKGARYVASRVGKKGERKGEDVIIKETKKK